MPYTSIYHLDIDINKKKYIYIHLNDPSIFEGQPPKTVPKLKPKQGAPFGVPYVYQDCFFGTIFLFASQQHIHKSWSCTCRFNDGTPFVWHMENFHVLGYGNGLKIHATLGKNEWLEDFVHKIWDPKKNLFLWPFVAGFLKMVRKMPSFGGTPKPTNFGGLGGRSTGRKQIRSLEFSKRNKS